MKRQERLDDPETSLNFAMDGRQARMWTALPGIVHDVDLQAQTISVQPAIQAIETDQDGVETNTNMPLLVDVPVVWPRAGGFCLTFPIAAGDEVLVVFASRCIDAWHQSGGVQAQAEQRKHDLSDAFAILAPTSSPNVVGGVSANAVQLRNDSGTAYVEVDSSGKVNIVSSSEVNINAQTANITAPEVEITASTKIDLTSPMINLNGITSVDGDLTVTPPNNLVSNGINYANHRHTGVQAGPDTSGGPVN